MRVVMSVLFIRFEAVCIDISCLLYMN